IDRTGVDELRTQRRVAVAALGAHVRTLVVRAQIVEAEVVGSRDPSDVRPCVLDPHMTGGHSDDKCDLALEGEQFGAGGALDGAAGCRDGTGGLEEVRRVRGPPAALIGAGCIAEVDRDDLARSGCQVRHGGRLLASRSSLLCDVFEIVYHPDSGSQASLSTPDNVVTQGASMTDQPGFTPTGTIAGAADRRRVVFATVVGTTVEWYDFFIYATTVGLVFGQLFFSALGTN